MAVSKVMTGGRAKIFVDNQLVGIFESASYSMNVGTEPIHILGRYSPSEIAVTGVEAVSISCSGFRIIGNGVHILPKMPKLQDLLNLEAVTITIVDRQSGQTVLTAIGCIPNSYSGGFNARATSRVTINYLGVKAFDESGDMSEPGAADLP